MNRTTEMYACDWKTDDFVISLVNNEIRFALIMMNKRCL